MKRWLMNILNVISVLLIAASVFVLCTVVMTRRGEAPSIFGYSMFRVMTGSMEPEIRADSLIVVKQEEPSSIRQGDIISYYSSDPQLGGAVNTHRVVSVECNADHYSYVTRGDANALPDQYPVAEESLLGKVIYVSYPLGVAVNIISQPVAFFLLILFPLMALLIVNLCRTISSARKIMRAEEEAAVREAVEEVRRKRQQQKALEDNR